jgi:non-heme chloroperoxidase
MSTGKLATPDHPASASSALSLLSRRRFLSHSATIAAAASMPIAIGGKAFEQANPSTRSKQKQSKGDPTMSTITTKDGVEIFYKDWGKGQPIVFSHCWLLPADDWDTQMSFFLAHGYRVIAHDRRGHGRSTQTGSGHEQ